jgi:ribonuclease P protein component
VQDAQLKIFYQKLEIIPNQAVVHQFGFAVPKKNFAKAVDRNRIKRILREIVRQQKNKYTFSTSYAFFISYTHNNMPTYENLSNRVHELFEKIAKLNSKQSKDI